MDGRAHFPAKELADMAKELQGFADEARTFITATLHNGVTIDAKSDDSLVTNIDKGVETIFRDRVSKVFPEHGVLGEEFGHHNPGAPIQWVIDPIDGTTDFTRGIPTYGTVVGAFVEEQPLVALLDFPALDERYHAIRGGGAYGNGERLPSRKNSGRTVISFPPHFALTRSGKGYEAIERLAREFPDYRTYWTCYTHALAASGATDATVELNLRIWDIAAAELLAQEAGKDCHWIERPSPWASGTCSLVLGEKSVVERIITVLGESLAA